MTCGVQMRVIFFLTVVSSSLAGVDAARSAPTGGGGRRALLSHRRSLLYSSINETYGCVSHGIDCVY